MVLVEAGIKFLSVPQPKPMHGVLPNFQDMFAQRETKLIRFWGYLTTAVAIATLISFWGS